MNLSIYPTQSNTKAGPFPVLAAVALTAGLMVKLVNAGGVMKATLPADVDDKPDCLVLEDAAAGTLVTVLPLDRSQNVRVRLDGTCNPGDELTLAAINGANDGKVRTLPAAADTYFVFLRAEEIGVDEQLVLCRPILNPRSVIVA